jgi:hypothetical protein
MPSLRPYRIFISHAWDYSDDYHRVVGFLDEAPCFRWENLSVPEHDPVDDDDIPYELRNQMRKCDAFLIIAGMYAANREWIDFEMRFARRVGRPIIGIRKWAGQRVPLAIQHNAREVVGWNRASVVSAIRRHALKYVAPVTPSAPPVELPKPAASRPAIRISPPTRIEPQPNWWQSLRESQPQHQPAPPQKSLLSLFHPPDSERKPFSGLLKALALAESTRKEGK